MPRLSIVIPCAHGADSFEDTLVSVLQNRPSDCEVLVVQPQAYDDPYDLCGEVRFVEATTGSSLVDLINVGVRSSRGDCVHLLSCHTLVENGWADAVLPHFDDAQVGSVSPLLVDANDHHKVLATGVDFGIGGELVIRNQSVSRDQLQRRRTLAPTLHAGFYRRQAVLDAGCFCQEAGQYAAGIEMGLAPKARGFRHVMERDALVISTSKVKPPLSLQHGKQAERLFWRHAGKRGWAASILAHPAAIASEVVRNIYRPTIALQLIGRTVAAVHFFRRRGQPAEVTPAAEATPNAATPGTAARTGADLLKYRSTERQRAPDRPSKGRRRAA